MTAALVRPASAVAWELRTAWAVGLRVSLTIDADVTRVEGFVTRVAATGAYAMVNGLHVPLERVLAVHRPSLLGDSDRGDEPWLGPIPEAVRDRDPRQREFDLGDHRGEDNIE